jgi:Domain of unknown function(DUF2779)
VRLHYRARGTGALSRTLVCPYGFYLDFEAFLPAVPLYPGTRPYQTIPFQWSLHRVDSEGTVSHREFLAEGDLDPRRQFAETLIAALPQGRLLSDQRGTRYNRHRSPASFSLSGSRGRTHRSAADRRCVAGMNGRELAKRALNIRPGLKVLFMTGYSRNAIVHQGRLDPGVELIQKPITQDQLAARIRGLLDTGPKKGSN